MSSFLRLFSLCILLGIHSLSSAHAGDEMGNGGGIAERNIYYAYTNLGTYIRVCLGSGVCKLAQSERKILTNILTNLQKEYATDKQLTFMAESKNPGFFILDGEVKFAKTGSTVGGPIYINTDLLYLKNSNGVYEATTIAQGIAVLVHEMGHHHGEPDHLKLDVLGNKVASMFEKQSVSASLEPLDMPFKIAVYNPEQLEGFPQALLYMDGFVFSISQGLQLALRCTRKTVAGPIRRPAVLPILRRPDIAQEMAPVAIDGTESYTLPLGSTFYNLYWDRIRIVGDTGEFTIKGNVANTCIENSQALRDKNYKLYISFQARKVPPPGPYQTPRWHLVRNSMNIYQAYERWWDSTVIEGHQAQGVIRHQH